MTKGEKNVYLLNMVLMAENLTKSYPQARGELKVLKGINLIVEDKDFIAIVGESGVGKTTLLQILGLLDKPTSGRLLLDSVDPLALPEQELAEYRNQRIGFVFQFHHLMPEFTVEENIALPMLMSKRTKGEAISEARYLLERFSLEDKSESYPHQLSGGERQRVAVLRAIANKPQLLIADEPTGNLDERNSRLFEELLVAINNDGQTVILATHNIEFAKRGKRNFILSGGTLREMEGGTVEKR